MIAPRLLTIKEIEYYMKADTMGCDCNPEEPEARCFMCILETAKAALRVVEAVRAYKQARYAEENMAIREAELYETLLPFRESEKGGAND